MIMPTLMTIIARHSSDGKGEDWLPLCPNMLMLIEMKLLAVHTRGCVLGLALPEGTDLLASV